MKKLYAVYFLNLYDLVITMFGIHVLGITEGNPLMADIVHNHIWLATFIKIVFVGAVILGLGWFLEHAVVSKVQTVIWRITKNLMLALYMFVAVTNTLAVALVLLGG